MPSRRRRPGRRGHSQPLTRRTIRVGQNGGGILLPALPATGERSAGVRRLCVADLPPLRCAARARRRAWHRLAPQAEACATWHLQLVEALWHRLQPVCLLIAVFGLGFLA